MLRENRDAIEVACAVLLVVGFVVGGLCLAVRHNRPEPAAKPGVFWFSTTYKLWEGTNKLALEFGLEEGGALRWRGVRDGKGN